MFGKAKIQYEQPRALFLNGPDPTGERLVDRTLALVEPLLGVPVAIIDLEELAGIGIGEAAPGQQTVTDGAAAGNTHGAGTTGGGTSGGQGTTEGRGAGGPTTGPSAGAGLGSGAPSDKAAVKRRGKGKGHGAGRTGAVSSKGKGSSAGGH